MATAKSSGRTGARNAATGTAKGAPVSPKKAGAGAKKAGASARKPAAAVKKAAPAKKATAAKKAAPAKKAAAARKPTAAARKAAPAKKATAAKKRAAAPAKKAPAAQKRATARAKKAPAARKASAPARRAPATVAVASLDDVPAFARQLAAAAGERPRVSDAGLAEVAQVLGALGRRDLAAALLAALPAGMQGLWALLLAAEAGDDIEPLWPAWLAAAESTFLEQHELLLEELVHVWQRAREPARGQLRPRLDERVRAYLEGRDEADDLLRAARWLQQIGDPQGARRLADRVIDLHGEGILAHPALIEVAHGLLDDGPADEALALLGRMDPSDVGRILADSRGLAGPIEPATRARLDRLLAALDADEADAVRGRLAWAERRARLAGGEDIEGPGDLEDVEVLLASGHLEAARRLVARSEPPAHDPTRWARMRFRLGLDDLAPLLATAGQSPSAMANVGDWIDIARLLLERDPRDPAIDQVVQRIDAALKKGPLTRYDQGVFSRFVLLALALRADVALARGESLDPLLERVRDRSLDVRSRLSELRFALERWHRAGRPDDVEATVRQLPPSLHGDLASFVAQGFLPDLGRAIGALLALEKKHPSRHLSSLAALLRATATPAG